MSWFLCQRRIPALDAGVHEIPDTSTLCVVIARAVREQPESPPILGETGG